MARIYDKFGRPQEHIGYKWGEMEPYLVEENTDTGITYICYDDGVTRAIRKITETTVGNVTTTKIEIGYGAWANRASVTYQPINKALSV